MSLETQIMAQLKDAMRAKDSLKLEALRAVKSAILVEKTKQKDAQMTEADEMKLLQKLVKQRKDSAEIFEQQNRAEMAKVELEQAAVIEQFLPQQMSKEAIENAVNEIISSVGATTMKDMGKVMGIASKELAGKADGKIISTIVREKLS